MRRSSNHKTKPEAQVTTPGYTPLQDLAKGVPLRLERNHAIYKKVATAVVNILITPPPTITQHAQCKEFSSICKPESR